MMHSTMAITDAGGSKARELLAASDPAGVALADPLFAALCAAHPPLDSLWSVAMPSVLPLL